MNQITSLAPSHARRNQRIHMITRENTQQIHVLLEGGESLEVILAILKNQASNAAIKHIANNNKMLGRHREDFRIRANGLL